MAWKLFSRHPLKAFIAPTDVSVRPQQKCANNTNGAINALNKIIHGKPITKKEMMTLILLSPNNKNHFSKIFIHIKKKLPCHFFTGALFAFRFLPDTHCLIGTQ
jgi:hypothetical protein